MPVQRVGETYAFRVNHVSQKLAPTAGVGRFTAARDDGNGSAAAFDWTARLRIIRRDSPLPRQDFIRLCGDVTSQVRAFAHVRHRRRRVLYRMCRGIVGTLVQIGLGKFPPNALPVMVSLKDRARWDARSRLRVVFMKSTTRRGGSD